MQNFSTRLAEAIAKSGKSKGALAASTGVALSTVSRWLGGTLPKADTIAKIAKFLGVDAKWLLSGGLDSENAQSGISLAEMEAMFGDPVFRNAWEAATLESRLEYKERLRRIVSSSGSSYAEKLLKYRATAREFFVDIEEVCDLTGDEYPIEPGEDRGQLCRRKALLLSTAAGKIYGDLQELILDCLALRDLAETSPATLRILRESQSETESAKSSIKAKDAPA